MNTARSRPKLLYGTARAGTTPFYCILAEYFFVLEGRPGHHELFNVFVPRSVGVDNWRELSFQERNSQDEISFDMLGEQLLRAKLFRESGYRDFFKMLAGSVPPPIVDELRETHEWIFVERRNKFEQMLSYLASRSTGEYYRRGGLRFQAGQIRATTDQMKQFEAKIFEYQMRKTELRPQRVLIFEDLIKESPKKVLSHLKLDPEVDLSGLRMPDKQNLIPKENYFCNLGEIRNFYKCSLLQTLHPIS